MLGFAPSAVSLSLSGWGWCPAYACIAGVTVDLNGSVTPRTEAATVADIYLAGTLYFDTPDRSDNFSLDLRGTRNRSVFFLRQVSGGDDPIVAEFEGTWLVETDYVACEGRLASSMPNHLAKPYLVVLRTADTPIPSRSQGSFAETVDYVVVQATALFDAVADNLAGVGSNVKDTVGSILTKLTTLTAGLRDKLGIPYIT